MRITTSFPGVLFFVKALAYSAILSLFPVYVSLWFIGSLEEPSNHLR